MCRVDRHYPASEVLPCRAAPAGLANQLGERALVRPRLNRFSQIGIGIGVGGEGSGQRREYAHEIAEVNSSEDAIGWVGELADH